MNGPLSLGIEMVVCFVMLDFALEQRWAVAACAMASWVIIAVVSRKSAKKNSTVFAANSKQGGYGKVVVFKESLLQQLAHPAECLAMIRCKLGALGPKAGGSGATLGENVMDALGLRESDVTFCEAKLVAVSRSFAQVITFLPNSPAAPLRLSVAVFYLVLRALDTVEDDMNLDRFDAYVEDVDKKNGGVGQDARLIAKQRLLRDFANMLETACGNVSRGTSRPAVRLQGLGEADERELVENLDALIRVLASLPSALRAEILAVTAEMGAGMADYIARDLRNGTDDDADFERYCHIAAGTVGDGLTRLFARCGTCPASLVARRDLWDSMGSFLQRTNIIRDYLEDMVDGRAWWPKSVWERFAIEDTQFGRKPSLSCLAESSSIESGTSLRCLSHMVADALELIPNCIAYIDALGDDASVLSFCALPQVMAIATLADCFLDPRVFQGVVKIRKGLAARIMVDFAPMPGKTAQHMRTSTRQWFARFVAEIKAKADYDLFKSPESDRVSQLCQNLELVINKQDGRKKKRID